MSSRRLSVNFPASPWQRPICWTRRVFFGRTPAASRQGSVLIAVVWCLVLLSAGVLSLLHSTRFELRITKNHGDVQQAYYLAIAGVEKAKALIYHETKTLRESDRSHSQVFFDSSEDFQDISLGRGRFRVFRPAVERQSGKSVVYGMSNEEGRLNINHAMNRELRLVPYMTDDVAAAIVDWRDTDNDLTTGGAEQDDYLSLSPPYLPGDAALQTIRELLRVRGVTHRLFFGEDGNGNGTLDANENDGDRTEPTDNGDGLLDQGWSGIFTVDSGVANVDARGQPRVNVQEASAEDLQQVDGITEKIARAIVFYRRYYRLESIAHLLYVTHPREGQQAEADRAVSEDDSSRNSRARPPPPPQLEQDNDSRGDAPGREPAQQNEQTTGGTVNYAISTDLLKRIADRVTVQRGGRREGAININTASEPVLACLTRVTEELARAIVHRRRNQPFTNVAQLLDVPGMTREVFLQICNRVTVRAETFRLFSEGLVPSTGARKRLEVVLRYESDKVETLYYREEP